MKVQYDRFLLGISGRFKQHWQDWLAKPAKLANHPMIKELTTANQLIIFANLPNFD